MHADEQWMALALEEAGRGAEAGEVPVGAVVVVEGRLVGRAHNTPISLSDPTAHAEILALRSAARETGNYRLTAATLYVTVEPCVMCAGATYWAHLGRLVFGAFDEKLGYRRIGNLLLHVKTKVTGGILEPECADLMKAFFKKKRAL